MARTTPAPDHFPPGPALLYVLTPSARLLDPPGTESVLVRVDNHQAITEGGSFTREEAARERAVLRALLTHSLLLLDQEEGR